MWPFTSTDHDTEIVDAVARLRAFRDVGETFTYLGRECIVTGHWENIPYVGTSVPTLLFDYCDDCGLIRSGRLSVDVVMALRQKK